MPAEPAAELTDAEELVIAPTQPAQPGRLLSWLWPKLAAVALGLAVWQAVVWSGWRPDYVLPGPLPVATEAILARLRTLFQRNKPSKLRQP